MDTFSSRAVRTLLTSLFSSAMIDDPALACEVVEGDRKIDIKMLVWTLVIGFVVGDDA